MTAKKPTPSRQAAAVAASAIIRRQRADARMAAEIGTRGWLCIAPADVPMLFELLKIAEEARGGVARAAAGRARTLVAGGLG